MTKQEIFEIADENGLNRNLFLNWVLAKDAIFTRIPQMSNITFIEKEYCLYWDEFKIYLDMINDSFLELKIEKNKKDILALRIDKVTDQVMHKVCIHILLVLDTNSLEKILHL